MSRKDRFKPLILSLFIILADQISKALVCKYIPEGAIYRVIGDDLIWICHAKNTGIAFGMGAAGSDFVRVLMFILFPAAVILYLTYLAVTGKKDLTELQRWCAAGIIGGSIGNLIDRIFRYKSGGVVDFISVKFFGILGIDRWPTFNIGDSFVVVFVFIFAGSVMFSEKKKDKKTDVKVRSFQRGK